MRPEERETTINWSEADETATIDTFSRKVITKCKKLGYKVLKEYKSQSTGKIIGCLFECPIFAISFRRPVRRTLTDEQREKLRKGMKKQVKEL